MVQETEPCEPDGLREDIRHSMSIEDQLQRNRNKRNPDKLKAEEERRIENDIKAVSVHYCNVFKFHFWSNSNETTIFTKCETLLLTTSRKLQVT